MRTFRAKYQKQKYVKNDIKPHKQLLEIIYSIGLYSNWKERDKKISHFGDVFVKFACCFMSHIMSLIRFELE